MPHKIIHLNCHIFAGTLAAFFRPSLIYCDGERGGLIARWIITQRADVAILSEVWSGAAKDAIQRALSSEFTFFARADSRGAEFDADGGGGCCSHDGARGCECLRAGPEFLIASRFPMHDFSVTRFARLTGWDAMSRKMAFGFHVLGSFICATHFDSADGEARASNLAQVIEHVRRYGRDRPAIIVGDLNICELAGSALCAEYVAAREALAADGFADAYRAVWTDAAAYPGYTVDAARNEIARHFGGGLARLDYFWTRGYDLRAIPYLIKLALTEDGSVGAFARATTPLACAMEGTPPAESCAVERVDGGASDARDLRSAQSDVHAIALSDHYPISLVVDSL